MVFDTVAGILSDVSMINYYDITPEVKIHCTRELTGEQEIEPLDLAKLIIRCEKRFRVTIHDEFVQDFHCIGDLVKHIEALIEEKEEITPVKSDKERESWYYR